MVTDTNSTRITCLLLTGCLLVSGCNEPIAEQSSKDAASFESVKPTVDPAVIAAEDRELTADEMREALGANENAQFEKRGRKFTVALLTNSGAKSLEPLKGQPLKVLDLSQTRITDLSPLAGMDLENIGMAETEVADLSPLAGMPLKFIDATRSQVADISPLKGTLNLTHAYFVEAKVRDITPLASSPLKVLWLNACPVEDLSPLENKQLEELNLCDTPLQDLKTIKTMTLGTLWMRNTKVQDLSPIANHKLVSLDIQGSAVNNLEPLKAMDSLKRLNISQTEVTDLTPLAGLSLERFIFSPSKIQKGIDAVRQMGSLRQLDISFEGVDQPMSPSVFWERYDAGEFKAEIQ